MIKITLPKSLARDPNILPVITAYELTSGSNRVDVQKYLQLDVVAYESPFLNVNLIGLCKLYDSVEVENFEGYIELDSLNHVITVNGIEYNIADSTLHYEKNGKFLVRMGINTVGSCTVEQSNVEFQQWLALVNNDLSNVWTDPKDIAVKLAEYNPQTEIV